MQILVERLDDIRNEILYEEVNGTKKKRYMIEGICIQSDIENRNRRIYPYGLVKPVIDRYIKEDIAKHRSVGHLNHPATDPRNDPKEVSHKFISLTEDGKNWIGKAVVTTGTPNGAIVAGLMDEGVNMGISSRATGKVKSSKGIDIVQTFSLISPGDIVTDPSAPDAYLTNLMEGKERVWQNGFLVEQEKEIRQEINTLAKTKRLDEAKMIELFQKLIKTNQGKEKWTRT